MDRDCHDRRTQYAFNSVDQIVRKDAAVAESFRSLVRSFPIMLYNNGLSAAVSFLFAKKLNDGIPDKAKCELYVLLQYWFRQEGLLDEGKDLMDGIKESSSDIYRMMAAETLTLMGWVKRFAEGMIN